MRIRDIMSANVITVSPDTLIVEAERIMKENNIRRLPVVEEGELVGIVTKYDLLEASPSPATSLSVYELNYLLARMQVREIMTEHPYIVTPDTPFEEALAIGQKERIGSFPVVEDHKLVGIATESDIVRFLAHVMGLGEEGLRVTIEGLGGEAGQLEKVISIASAPQRMILSMILAPRPKEDDWMVVLRLKTADPEGVVKEFKDAGLEVSHAAVSARKQG
jgi:acetoin utilization protein AcuB